METKTKQKPTPRQRKAAKAIVENLLKDKPEPLNAVLENVGYGQIVQDPQRITESKGFKQALYDLGMTEELITTSLVSDINAKPANRIQELKLGADILGMVKREEPDDKPKGNTTYINIFNAETQAEIKEIEARIKARLINVQTLEKTVDSN